MLSILSLTVNESIPRVITFLFAPGSSRELVGKKKKMDHRIPPSRDSHSASLESSLWVCTSNKFPGEDDAAGLGAIL